MSESSLGSSVQQRRRRDGQYNVMPRSRTRSSSRLAILPHHRSFVRLSVVLNKHLLRMPTRIVCTQTPLVYFPIYLRTYFISILQMLMLLQVLLAYLSCSCSRIIMSALNTHFMWHVSSVFVCGCFKLIVDLFI